MSYSYFLSILGATEFGRGGFQDDGHDVGDTGNVGGGEYDDHYLNHFL